MKGESLRGNNATTTEKVTEMINDRNKNIYVCMFNRKRLEHNIKSEKNILLQMLIKIIVPVMVDLDTNDGRLYNNSCQGEQNYLENLNKVEINLLITPTTKDHLYFAANLRGDASNL